MQTVQMKSIQVKGLHKSFKQLQVLKGVDFEVEKGSIFAKMSNEHPFLHRMVQVEERRIDSVNVLVSHFF